jgi:hypothetical protein
MGNWRRKDREQGTNTTVVSAKSKRDPEQNFDLGATSKKLWGLGRALGSALEPGTATGTPARDRSLFDLPGRVLLRQRNRLHHSELIEYFGTHLLSGALF